MNLKIHKKRLKKMRKPITPRSKLVSALRRIWLYSRERSYAIKLQDHKCNECGNRESKKVGNEIKLEVHHINGINWDKIINPIYKYLLTKPNKLQVLCKDCHSIKTIGKK